MRRLFAVSMAFALLSTGCTNNPRPYAGVPSTPTWELLPTPPSGSVRSLTRTVDGTVFAGTTSGVYASNDDGATWTHIGLANTVVEALHVTQAGTILLGTYREGLLRSEDGGRTWERIGFDRNVYLYGIAQDIDGTLYLSATEAVGSEPTGMFRSSDDGRTWEPAGLATTGVFSLSTHTSGALFAGADSGLFATRDRGRTWAHADNGLPKGAIASSVIATQRTLLAGIGMRQDVRAWTGGEGVFRSDDDGHTWTRADAGLPPNTSVRALLAFGDTVLAATGGDLQSTSGSGIYRSIALGRWELTGLSGEWVRGLVRLPTGRLLAAVNDAAMFRSDDGGRTWTHSATGFVNWETYGIAALGERLLVSSGRGTYVSRDGGKTWTLTPGLSPSLALVPSDTLLYGSAQDAGVLVSRDSGTTWDALTPPNQSGVIRDLFRDRRGRLFAASMAGGSGLHESEDGGHTWRRLSLRPFENGDPPVFSVTVTPAGTIIAGTDNGLQRSTAEGQFDVVDSAFAFAIEACGKDTVYAAAYEKGLLRSTDDARTWSPITEQERLDSRQSGYLTLTSVLCLDDGRLLVGSLGEGILLSEDYGLTWADASDGLRNLNVWRFAKGQNGAIYVTSESGVHRLIQSW